MKDLINQIPGIENVPEKFRVPVVLIGGFALIVLLVEVGKAIFGG